MCDASIEGISSECLAIDLDDRRKQELVRELCDRVRLFGGGKIFTMRQFFDAVKVVERACKMDVRE